MNQFESIRYDSGNVPSDNLHAIKYSVGVGTLMHQPFPVEKVSDRTCKVTVHPDTLDAMRKYIDNYGTIPEASLNDSHTA